MSALTRRSLTLARAIHRTLLALVPGEVRQRYRTQMIATFEDASEHASRYGAFAVWRLLGREALDLIRSRRANRPAGVVFPPPASVSAANAGAAHSSGRIAAWRQAWRSLRHRPAFLAAAVTTLAFGTGITTAVFSLVDTVLLKPLPYPDAERLVTVYESSPSERDRTSLIAPGRLEDWNRLTRSFVAVSGSHTDSVTDTSAAEPERLAALRVAPRFFTVYATPPLVGRTFTHEEEQANGPGAVVLSERFWSRRFHRDPGAVGRALIIGGRPFPIVGVMPSTFTGSAIDVWLPAQFNDFLMGVRNARFLGGIAKLRPGVSVEQGARDLALVQEALAREYPNTDAGWSVEVRPLKEARIGKSRRGLVLVFGAVASLWIIAVANIAGLTLVQVRRRARELAIRSALGASRRRVIGTVIREGVLTAIVGGVLGSAFAAGLVALMPKYLTGMPRINEIVLDWRAVAFTAVTSLLATCAFSVVPAFAGTRSHLNQMMTTGTRNVAGASHRFQQLLVIAQVALSVVLVGSATLMLRSYHNLTRVETGLDPSNVVTFHVAARWDEDRTRIAQLQEQLLTRLDELHHVEAAGMTNFLPSSGAQIRYQVAVEGLSGPNADGSITIGSRTVTGGYLRAIRARLVAGSWCPPETINPKTPRAAMVNQAFVERHGANQNLVGRLSALTQEPGTKMTIVGVVADVAEDGPAANPFPYLYSCAVAGWWPDPEYVARTTDARAFAVDLRRIVRELDPGRAIFGLRRLDDVLNAALDQPRLDAAMLGLFAAAAVALAAVGLYSLFMLVVTERSREIAVRLAIGAAPRAMIRLVMTGAGRLLAIGIVLGIALTAAAARLLRGVVFGVNPLDMSALGAAAITLTLVSLVAVAAPAVKAARVSPIDALKGD